MNQLHILYLVSLLMDMSVAGVTFALSRRAAELGATPAELGWLGAVWIGVYALLALVVGRISDRVGRRRMAATGCLIAAAMAIACAWTTNIRVLLVVSGIFGGGLACYWPSIIAWLGEGLSGPVLARRLATFGMSWNTGLLLGYGFTGVLFKSGPSLAFYVPAGVILLIVVLLGLPTRADGGVVGRVPSRGDPERPLGAAGLQRSDSLVEVPNGRGFRKTAWVANFATNFAFAGTTALFPQLATHLGISAGVHGELLALSRGAAIASFIALNALAFWHTRLWPLWATQAVGALGIAWIAWGANLWVFAAAWIVIGAVSGYTYQASIYFTLEEMTEKGKGSGFHESIVGSGMFLGPVAAGWVGNHHGLRTPYLFCAVMLLLLIAAQMGVVLWRRRRQQTAV
jgi:MFS family permease